MTEDKKERFRKIFEFDIKKKNGPYSTELLENTKFFEKNDGKFAILFKDKKVADIDKDDKPIYFKKKNEKFKNEFISLLTEARQEYEKTIDYTIDKEIDWDNYQWDPFESNFFKESVVNNSIETLSDNIEDIQEEMKEVEMDEQDVRELNGVFDPKGERPQDKLEALEIQADHWRQKALLEVDEGKEKWYKDAEKTTRLVADKIRLKENLRPEEEETVSIIQQEIEESDIGRLERFKKWSKENLLGLSAVAISVAGILTTIIIGARNALKSGAKAVGNLGKSLVNIGKNFGALISSMLNLIGSILAWDAKGITFLAKNLWILTLAITYFFYNEYKERRKK